MAEDAVAYVSIVPESSGVGAKIAQQFDGDKVGAQMSDSVSKGFLSRVGSIGLGITKVVGGATAISAGLLAGIALKGGLERSLDIQGAEAKLAGLGHNTQSVADIMDNALSSVKGTAFGLGDAATVAATAVAANVKPGKDLTRYLTLMADASTIAGTSMADMGQIFNQVAARGSLTGDVVNQLQQRGIPILQLVADQYGVTAGAAADMVSAGQVDFATFEKAIESGMGGAALKSGNTAAGAFANVKAALGRLGQGFTDPLVASAPTLFNAIGKATDNAATALKPYADKFAAWVTPAIASLSTWIASIDFTTVISNVKTFFSSVQDAASGTSDAFSGIDLGGAFGTLFAILNPLMPIFVGIAQGLGTVAGSIGKLIGAGIALLPPIIDTFAGALGFLKDNAGLVTPLIITIVGAMLLYKASQIASNLAALAMIPAYTARTAVLLASIPASAGAAGATDIATAAVERQKIGLIRAVAIWIAQKAALIAGAIAQGAVAVAIGVVTAAQWLWNAAMSANPIGLIIIAIAALIAIIILVVMNWQTIVDFLYNVWNTVVTWTMGVLSAFFAFWVSIWNQVVGFFISIWAWIVATVTFYINMVFAIVNAIVAAIASVWNTVWGAISSFFVGIWNGIVAFVTTYINTVFLIINTVVAAIVSVWNTVWGAISSFFVSIWDGIVSFVTTYINTVMAIITAVGSAIAGVWSGIWNGIVSFFTGAWNNITGVLNTVGSAFGNAFGAVSGIVSGAFNGIVGVIKGAINGVIDLVNGAIGAINDTVGAAGAAFGVNIKIGKIPRLAEGGIVPATPGGGLYNIGEGRYSEAVVPLSPKVLDVLSGGSGARETTNNWNITEVSDPIGTALAVARRQQLLGV